MKYNNLKDGSEFFSFQLNPYWTYIKVNTNVCIVGRTVDIRNTKKLDLSSCGKIVYGIETIKNLTDLVKIDRPVRIKL